MRRFVLVICLALLAPIGATAQKVPIDSTVSDTNRLSSDVVQGVVMMRGQILADRQEIDALRAEVGRLTIEKNAPPAQVIGPPATPPQSPAAERTGDGK